MTDEAVVLRDTPARHVARLLINRPAKRNAIDFAVREQLTTLLREVLADADVRALVIAGSEGVFSAGGDVPSMTGLDEPGARARMAHIHTLCELVGSAPIPVVSAIEGIGAGGAIGLALLGDLIVVGNDTKILFPFLGLGLAPDWGQLLTLPRRIGLPNARRILTAGRVVTGAEALAIGLADELAPDGAVMATAIARASSLASLPQQAFAQMKERLSDPSVTLSEELQREEDGQVRCLLGEEFRAGFVAFTQKQKVDFSSIKRSLDALKKH